MVTTTKPVTVEELWEMRNELYRLALIDGTLYRLHGAGLLHGLVTTEFCFQIAHHVKTKRLGSAFAVTGFRLFPDRETTLFPEVAFVREKRLPPREERERFLNLAPDLAVEIYAPTDRIKILQKKLDAYAEAGTPLVWVAYPRRRSISVHPLGREPFELAPVDILDGDDVLPGFSIRVGELFP
jgi:Uma2 family endonuclease